MVGTVLDMRIVDGPSWHSIKLPVHRKNRPRSECALLFEQIIKSTTNIAWQSATSISFPELRNQAVMKTTTPNLPRPAGQPQRARLNPGNKHRFKNSACKACHTRKKRCVYTKKHRCTYCVKENQACMPRAPLARYDLFSFVFSFHSRVAYRISSR